MRYGLALEGSTIQRTSGDWLTFCLTPCETFVNCRVDGA